MGLLELESCIKTAKDKSVSHRDKRKAKNSPDSWRTIWQDAVKKKYPASVVTYPQYVSRNLQRIINSRGFPLEDMPKFLEWVVQDWHSLRRTVFSCNPKKPFGPDTPAMEFVIRYISHLHSEFQIRTKPEHQFSRYVHGHRDKPAPPKKWVPTKPPLPPNPVKYDPPKPLVIDHAENERHRIRLGLPSWDKK